jgi:uncharacterized GH25 family protein
MRAPTEPSFFQLLSLSFTLFLALAIQAQPDNSGGVIKGSIVDSVGRPIEGADIQQYRYGSASGQRFDLELGGEATSDANGTFEMPTSRAAAMPHTPAILIARKPGLAPAWVQIQAFSAGEPRFVLTPPSFLAGQVVDEAEKPVAGAEVFVLTAFSETAGEGSSRTFNYLSGKVARELFTAKAGTDGRFRIDNFPTNASAALLAVAPGKAQRAAGQQHFSPDSMPCRAGQEDIRLVMEPAGSVEGRIVGGEPGQVLPVAQINVLPEGPNYVAIGAHPDVMSQADGIFRLDSLPAGSYRIQAAFGTNRLPEWVAETVPITVESGKAVTGVELSAIRGGLLEVLVRSAKEGKPIEGASVNLYKPGYQTGLTSSSNGLFVFRLPPGDYQGNAFKVGWQPAQASASVEAGLTNRVEIEMAPPRKLAGVVRYPDGQPATNLAIQIVGDYSMQQASFKTDSAGRFEIERPATQRFPGNDMTPCLFVRDAERNLAVAQDLEEETDTFELRLAPAVSFVVQVQSEGKPVTNATAAFVFWTGNSGMHLNNLKSRTNTPGQLEFAGIPTGRRYGLQVSATGYGGKYLDLTSSSDEAKRVELDPVELRRADRKLSGKLVDTDGKPVAGASMQIHGEGQPNANISTDREGRFSFDVCEGPVTLFANSQNRFGNMSAEGGDTNVVMTLGEQSMEFGGGKPEKISGTVTDEAGKPVAGADIRVLPTDMPSRGQSDSNGLFGVTYVMQPWQRQNANPLLLVRDRLRNLAAAHEVLEGETNVAVRLEPALTVRGRVVGPKGEPLANAQVSLTLQAGRMSSQVEEQPVMTDKNGAFTFTALPPGESYNINASLTGYSQKNQSIEIPWDTNVFEMPPIALRIPNLILAGQVVDGKDKPVPGAHVQIASNDQPQSSTQTDTKGRFKFKVCEGTVRMYANGRNAFAQTTAEAGDTNVVIILADRSGQPRSTARRKGSTASSLKGKPLPNLASIGLAADAVPTGKPLLLCLLNIQERPSRRIARELIEQQAVLRQNGVALLAAQTVPASDEAWAEWKEIDPGLSPLGRVTEKSDQNKWATGLENLPWLILVDKQGIVTDEGFPIQDLELKLLGVEE